MALDPRYITAPSLQMYFVDKDSGFPLDGGKVFFYSDVNRTQPKDVFELTGSPPNYSFSPLPNPVILSSVGTMMDNNGNDIISYYFPFNADGDQELYYIVVQSSTGVPQFTREAWPNPQIGETPNSENTLFNYIPNGQFLLHTDLPNDALIAGSNIIAQGGWTFELPESLHSENTLEFIPINFTENPSNSPRFFAQFTCGAAGLDTLKTVRIKWNDVNKFSATNDFFTFAFWAQTDIDVPIAIDIIKYCGTDGTVVPAEEIATDVITPEGKMYVYNFQFPSNSGLVIDTTNNNDYVALDISLPVGISFVLRLTDAAMIDGQVNLQIFPLQTNADMVTRANDGWTDIPAYDGYDLYLPKVQTRYGYKYDFSQIGQIKATLGNIPSPLSDDAMWNDMLLDGTSYPFDGYSTIGIPFARLGNFLIANSSLANTPMFGTGEDFATAYATTEGDNTILRLTVNSDGTGVNYAADGLIATDFDFTGIPVYNTSTTGSNSIGYNAYSSGVAGNQIICKSLTFNVNANTAAATSGFTINNFSASTPPGVTSIYSFQTYYFVLHAIPASSLARGSGMDAAYFTFSSSTTNYYMWFVVNGEVDPTPGGTGIRVNLQSTDGGNDVAGIIREVMNAYQSTAIHVGAPPPDGSYFTFQTNPASVRNFHVWYAYTTSSPEPVVGGSTAIRVNISNSDSEATIVTKTLIAINSVQYAVPAAQGMFLRNADPNGIWDFDNLTRWSNVTRMIGPNIGTFEYSQFLSHDHEYQAYQDNGAQLGFQQGGDAQAGLIDSSNSGGSETRPVNMYVNYYIKY